jgi:hypothetical protein
MHENPVTNVAGWLAGIPKGARHFHTDTLDLDVALSSLTVKIIAKACRQSGKQQFASI